MDFFKSFFDLYTSNNSIHNTFKHGENFKIGQFCIIEEDVYVGDNVTIDNYVLLKKGTRIGNDCFIDSYVKSSGQNVIGKNCTIRYNATIAKDVHIGDDVFISPNVMTVYSDPDGNHQDPIIIGNNVFLGTGCTIDSGVTIVNDVIVAAMAYVNKNCLERKAIYGGIPAEIIKYRPVG